MATVHRSPQTVGARGQEQKDLRTLLSWWQYSFLNKVWGVISNFYSVVKVCLLLFFKNHVFQTIV